MVEHKAKPNVLVNFFVSKGGKKRKLGQLRMNKNPMIKSRQSKAEMAVAEEEVVMVNREGVVSLPQPHLGDQPPFEGERVIFKGVHDHRKGYPD